MKNTLIILILFLIILTSCKQEVPDDGLGQVGLDEVDEVDKSIIPIEVEEEGRLEPLDPLLEIIENLTLEEKIGQLIIGGFEGKNMGQDLEAYIRDYKLGGLILFSRNIENKDQTLALTNQIKDLNTNNKIPIFISIDEEGGRVSRLGSDYIKLPSARKIGKSTPSLANEYGVLIGQRLDSLGINLNFGPVFDIWSNPQNTVIGDRAFGSEPDLVSTMGNATYRGILSQGILPVIKHFPGHGDTSMDSHIGLPLVEKNLDDLETLELVPFIDGIKEGVQGLMVAHILYRNLDSLPATMSKVIINDILRESYSYDGLVFSDDMTMGAIVNQYTIEKASLEFLKAGGDMALICHGDSIPKVFEAIRQGLLENELSQEEIDEKLYRILKVKRGLGLDDKTKENLPIDDLNKRSLDLINSLK